MRGRFPNAGRVGAAIGLPTGLFGLGFPSWFMQEFEYGRQSRLTREEVIKTFAICGLLGLGSGYVVGRGVNILATNLFRKPVTDAAAKVVEHVAKEVGKPKL